MLMSLKHLTLLLDDLLNTDNPYFEGMVNQIYPPELKLNKNNASDTEAPFLVLYLSIFKGFVSSKFMINVTNNNEKFRSFKSKENIHKKEVGPYRGFGY